MMVGIGYLGEESIKWGFYVLEGFYIESGSGLVFIRFLEFLVVWYFF